MLSPGLSVTVASHLGSAREVGYYGMAQTFRRNEVGISFFGCRLWAKTINHDLEIRSFDDRRPEAVKTR